MTLCSYGVHHWSRWFVVIRFRFSIPSPEVRTTPRWTITARNSYINSCSSPNCSMCCSTSAKRSIKAWSTCLAWRGGMLRFRRFSRFSPHLLLLSNGEHILLKFCLSQGCHTMKFHTLVITCHLSETIMKGSLKFIKYRYLYRWHVECRTNNLPINFLKKNGNETGTCKKTVFVFGFLPSKTVKPRCHWFVTRVTRLPITQGIKGRIKNGSKSTERLCRALQKLAIHRQLLDQLKFVNKIGPTETNFKKINSISRIHHHGMVGIFAARLSRSPGQYYGGCQHRSAGVVPIWLPGLQASKCSAAPERWLWPPKNPVVGWLEKKKSKCRDKSHGCFFPNPQILKFKKSFGSAQIVRILLPCLPLLSTLGHTIVGKAIKIQPEYLPRRWDISDSECKTCLVLQKAGFLTIRYFCFFVSVGGTGGNR